MMIICFLYRNEKSRIITIPGRLQTVQKNVNPRYWKLIDEFRKLTGVGIVLNSSFNDNEEPIVCSPKDAIRTFFGTGLHELYIGNYKVRKL